MPRPLRERSWSRKFADAASGIWFGMRGQNSFAVHVPLASLVVLAGWALQVDAYQWCALLLCIALVLSAELLNSALEQLAKAITQEENEHVRLGLNIASGAVLVASLGAAVVGLIIFVPRLLALLSASSTS